MAERKMTHDDWVEARALAENDAWGYTTIAEYFGISQPSVSYRAKKDGWMPIKALPGTGALEINRKKVIQERAQHEIEIGIARGVQSQLDQLIGDAREDAIVEANAAEISRVMMLHRAGATRMRELMSSMFGELQLISVRQADLEHLVQLVALAQAADADDPKLAKKIEAQTIAAFQSLLGLDGRADIAKKLVDCMIKVIDIERRVYGIKDEVSEGDVAKALKELAAIHE